MTKIQKTELGIGSTLFFFSMLTIRRPCVNRTKRDRAREILNLAESLRGRRTTSTPCPGNQSKRKTGRGKKYIRNNTRFVRRRYHRSLFSRYVHPSS